MRGAWKTGSRCSATPEVELLMRHRSYLFTAGVATVGREVREGGGTTHRLTDQPSRLESLMPPSRTRRILAHVALAIGAFALLATGADHLDEYAANQFSTVPTIGTLFLLNFLSATLVGVALLLPLGRIARRFAAPMRVLLALSGIGIAASSLIGLWISESSSLFGFTDYGFRPTITVAIVAESLAIAALSAYLPLANAVLPSPLRRRPSH
jgi:hypothetical protein